ncbi:hypothetical protein Tco_0209598 [Tanacetum coccineum]
MIMANVANYQYICSLLLRLPIGSCWNMLVSSASYTLEIREPIGGTRVKHIEVHKNVKLAEKIVARMNEFDSDNMGAYVLLSNMYSSSGRNKDAANLRSMLSKKANRKKPACS